MGKTTLCNAITGLVPAKGSVRVGGEEVLGLTPNAVTARGVGYVPQGRRVWPSLSVDEHFRLAARGRKGPWTVQRVYATFPRLAERKSNGGAELSGGEQQMLAIGRALLLNPKLLVMDEPTEGLAPVIVRAGGGDAEVARRRRRDRGAAHRAEPGRRHRRRRHHRRDGQRAHCALDAGGRARRRPRPAAAPARREVGRRGRRSGRAGGAGGAGGGGGARLHGEARRRIGGAGRGAHGARPHALGWHAGRPAAGCDGAAGAAGAGERSARGRVSGRAHHRARRLRRRHLRHQGQGAALSAQLPRQAGPAHGDGRPLYFGQALVGHGASARGGAPPPARASPRCSPGIAARR